MSDDARDSDDANSITNKEAWDYFLNGPQDVFTCETCGAEAHRGNPPDVPGAFYAEVDNVPTIICDLCDEKYDWETIEARIRERRHGTPRSPIGIGLARIRAKFRPVTSWLPVPLSVHEVAPDHRASLLPEQSVFLGRLVAVLGFAIVLLIGVAAFAALAGALFVSPDTGVQWFSLTAAVYREWVLYSLGHPEFVLGVVGFGYLTHLVEYQHTITAPDRDVGRSRPRWHYLTVFSGIGLLGWFVWVLSQLDVVTSLLLPVGVLSWSIGAFTLVYFLHGTLQEDRWSYGLRVYAALWKFPAQFAIGLMVVDGIVGLPGPRATAFAVAIVPPAVGVLYAAHRYIAFTETGPTIGRWVQQVTYRWRQLAPWPSGISDAGRGGSMDASQFGQLDQPSDDDNRAFDQPSGLDRTAELQQTREWASYLESELHDREEQLQDLEARLVQVRQELKTARQADSSDEATSEERDNLLTDLFDIRDNFRRALDAESSLAEGVAADIGEGIELIDSQIRSVLKREGVEEIDTSGEVDPEKHRVIKMVTAADANPGEIVDVYQQGYRQDDRILREAQVVVATEPDAGDGAEPPDDDSQINRGEDAS